MADIQYEQQTKPVAFIICDRCHEKAYGWRQCYVCKRTICKNRESKDHCDRLLWVGSFEEAVCADCYKIAKEFTERISQADERFEAELAEIVSEWRKASVAQQEGEAG